MQAERINMISPFSPDYLTGWFINFLPTNVSPRLPPSRFPRAYVLQDSKSNEPRFPKRNPPFPHNHHAPVPMSFAITIAFEVRRTRWYHRTRIVVPWIDRKFSNSSSWTVLFEFTYNDKCMCVCVCVCVRDWKFHGDFNARIK